MTASSARRAVIYARISLDRTGQRLGVERQIEDCLELAERQGLKVVATLSDNDISAYSGKRRPGYEELLRMVREGHVDVVLAWHVDRLHRSLSDLEDYIDASNAHDVDTHTARAGELDLSRASGRLIARMLGTVARHESEQKSERVRRARRQAAEAGHAHGPLGYGYDSDQNVVPSEAAVVREVASRVLEGESLRSIAADLNTRAILTPGAAMWRWQHVRLALATPKASPLTDAQVQVINALSSEAGLTIEDAAALAADAWPGHSREPVSKRLAHPEPLGHGAIAALLTASGIPAPATSWRAANLGRMIQRGTLCGWRDFAPGTRTGGGTLVAEGDWTPILDKATLEDIRSILRAPGRRPVGRHPKYLLSGVLICGLCGSRLVGTTDTRTGSRRYQCTRVPGTKRCGRLTVAGPPVEDLVTAAVLAALGDASFDTATAVPPTDLESLRALTDLELEEAGWRRDLAAGVIDRPTFLDALDGLKKRRQPLQREVRAMAEVDRSAIAGLPQNPAKIRSWWAGADTESRRRTIRALIHSVDVAPAVRGGNAFDPARLRTPIWRA